MAATDDAIPTSGPLPEWVATLLVFGTSAAVLVLEILAGRLLAPYVGVSIETFTGIIGVILAGIAVGSWVGGVVADHVDPRRLIPPLLIVGGALAISSIPIVRVIGADGQGGSPAQILILTTFGFLPFSIVLSAIPPAVVKLQLRDLSSTGSTVGRLSAWGTAGALTGTFLTGFVLVATAAVTTLIVTVGVVLVVVGLAWWIIRAARGRVSDVGTVVGAVAAGALGGLGAATIEPPCDTQTPYYCVSIVAAADDPSVRTLILDDLRHSVVDVDDPTRLSFWYVRRLADGIDAHAATLDIGAADPIRVLHIGGGALTLPRFLSATRAGSEQLVLEIDAELVDVVADEFGPVDDANLSIRTGDARLELDDLDDGRFDVVIGDAFGSRSVPFHLATEEFVSEIGRVLRPGGLYALNVIDGARQNFLRSEARTFAAVFEHVVVIRSSFLLDGLGGNAVLLASDRPIDAESLADRLADDLDPDDAANGHDERGSDDDAGPDEPADASNGVLAGDALRAFIGDAPLLTDDFAPVDQLIQR